MWKEITHYDIPEHLHPLFWRRVDKSGDCWLWTGRLRYDGYAQYTWVDSEKICHTTGGHRAAWSLIHGDIPAGMQLDHLCRVRHCVNPAHLEIVTPRVNTLRSEAISAKNVIKECCSRGHPFDKRTVTGHRYCGECMRITARERWAKQNAAMGKETLPRNSDRTHCPRGHEYTGLRNPQGSRICRPCDVIKQRAYRERKMVKLSQ